VPIKLAYIGKQDMGSKHPPERLWNVIAPQIPGYSHTPGAYPTFSLGMLQRLGLIPGGK
jgi:hypothetical protein